MFRPITTIDKRYLSGKSPLAISREMYDWTLEEGYTSPPSWCTLKKARMPPNNTRKKFVFLNEDKMGYPSFEVPNRDLCDDIVDIIERHIAENKWLEKNAVISDKKIPGNLFPVPDDYLEDIMSLTLADFEYLESKLPRGIFKDITKYLKSPRAIKECERLHDEFLTRFCTSYDKI